MEKCLTCPTVALNKQLCTKCNDNYYPMENITLNMGEYFNRYHKTPQGYYLDINDLLYKRCHYSCEACEIKGDNKIHNCLKCSNEFNFEIKINNYSNCYQKCSYYYYFDNEDNYHCTKNLSCPLDYPKFIEDKKECVNLDIQYIENLIDTLLNFGTKYKNENEAKEVEIKNYNKILEKLELIFTSDNYDLTNIDKGEDEILKAKKIVNYFYKSGKSKK